MAWDEDRRRAPSTSRANDPENRRKAPQLSGTTNEGTAAIAQALGDGDTREARRRLHLATFRRDPEAEDLLERMDDADVAKSISPTQRIALGLYAENLHLAVGLGR